MRRTHALARRQSAPTPVLGAGRPLARGRPGPAAAARARSRLPHRSHGSCDPSTWQAHRAPLLDAIREAQQAREARREGARAKMARVRTLRSDMRSLVTELGERDEAIARLQVELGKKRGQSRSAYTERILDIVRNLRKQKAGIAQILMDIKGSQKEVRRRWPEGRGDWQGAG